MKKFTPFLGSLVFGCSALVSCKQEAAPETEKEEPLTLQDIAVSQEFEDSVAQGNEAIAGAQKKRDEINAKIKASEENAKKLNDILGGN